MGDLLLVAALLVLFGMAVGFALGLWAGVLLSLWTWQRMTQEELAVWLREECNYPAWAATLLAERLRGNHV